jgi:hypothetical protein
LIGATPDSILERLLDKVEAGIPLSEAEVSLLRLARRDGRVNYTARSGVVVSAAGDVRDNVIVSGSRNIILEGTQLETFQRTLHDFTASFFTATKTAIGVLVPFCLSAVLLWLPSAFRHAHFLDSIVQYFTTLFRLLVHPKTFLTAVVNGRSSVSETSIAVSIFIAVISVQHLAKLLLSVGPRAVLEIRRSLVWGTLAFVIVISLQGAALWGIAKMIGLQLAFPTAFAFEAYFWSINIVLVTAYLFLDMIIVRRLTPDTHFTVADLLEAQDDPTLLAEYNAQARRSGELLLNRLGVWSAAYWGTLLAILAYKILPISIVVIYFIASGSALAEFFAPEDQLPVSFMIFFVFQFLSLLPVMWLRSPVRLA